MLSRISVFFSFTLLIIRPKPFLFNNWDCLLLVAFPMVLSACSFLSDLLPSLMLSLPTEDLPEAAAKMLPPVMSPLWTNQNSVSCYKDQSEASITYPPAAARQRPSWPGH